MFTNAVDARVSLGNDQQIPATRMRTAMTVVNKHWHQPGALTGLTRVDPRARAIKLSWSMRASATGRHRTRCPLRAGQGRVGDGRLLEGLAFWNDGLLFSPS